MNQEQFEDLKTKMYSLTNEQLKALYKDIEGRLQPKSLISGKKALVNDEELNFISALFH